MKQTTLKPLNTIFSTNGENGSDNVVTTSNPCPRCGYVNVPGVVICWKCGWCLDSRIRQLEEGSG